jgi:hypothetical protein
MRTTSKRSKAMNQGYEPGSRMDSMSPKERKAFKEWLKRYDQDSRALESQLRRSTF